MNIKKFIPSINKYADKDLPFIFPSQEAHEGQCVPQLIVTYGNIANKIRSFPTIVKYLGRSIQELKKSYREVNIQPKKVSKNISEDQLTQLYEFIFSCSIDAIGCTTVSPSHIFSNQKIVYPHAIVLLMHMDHTIMKGAPSRESEKEILRTYYALNVAVNKIKRYLNEHNFHAEAGPALGGEANYPVLAERAGLGAIGTHGLLITPSFGPSVRIAVVYTDIENLPIQETNDHLWIKEFCKGCKACVRNCPSQAIYEKPIIYPDKSELHIDFKKCAVPFSRHNACSICINHCPFFTSSYQKVKSSFLR
jgi:ferredoxin